MWLQPRWVGFAVVAVLVAAGCVRLGFWQLHRHEQRTAFNDAVTDAGRRHPVPASALLSVGSPVPSPAEWRPVTASGRYDTARELLVRNSPYEGRNGYFVVTPLVTGSGAALLVNRGWVPAGETAATRPRVPAPPSGTVVVTARVRPSQDAGDGRADRAPQGQVIRIDVPRIAERLPYPVLGGYVELTSQRPASADAPLPVPPPELGIGPHLAYAVQWWIFAVIALVGWVVLVRREGLEDADSEEAPDREPIRQPG